MKHRVACLFLIVFVIGFTHTQAEEKCTPGEQKQESCNTCTCTSTGVFMCTRKECLRKRDAEKCTPGETKQVECNTCTCTSTGEYACTLKLCLNKREISARFNSLVARQRREAECQPGETKQEACNTCTCTSTGVFACTRKLCLSKREAISSRFNPLVNRQKRDVPLFADLETTPCAPNDYFQIDCNTCYCNIDRTGYLCTENLCHDSYIDLSTTSQIPLTDDSKLIISNMGVQFVEDINSEDNAISRIPKSLEANTGNMTKNRL